MAYGFKSYNSDGRVVIDTEKSCYTEIASGSISIPEEEHSLNDGQIDYPSGYSNLLLAFKFPEGAVFSIQPSDSRSKVIREKETSDVPLPYKIFATQGQVGPSSDEFGVRVFDSSGTITFDSGHTTFNIISNHIRSVYETSDKYVDIYANADDWFVIGAGGHRAMVAVTKDFGYLMGISAARLSNGNVRFSIIPVANTVGGTRDYYASGFFSAMRVKIT